MKETLNTVTMEELLEAIAKDKETRQQELSNLRRELTRYEGILRGQHRDFAMALKTIQDAGIWNESLLSWNEDETVWIFRFNGHKYRGFTPNQAVQKAYKDYFDDASDM